MTIDEVLLQNLGRWRPEGDRQTLELAHAESGWQLALTAERVDAIGARLRDLRVSRLTPLPAPVPLAERAARVAAQVTGLLEPLRLVEVDLPLATAQLRSEPPARRGDTLAYYELLLEENGRAVLRRYEAPSRGGKRTEVAFALTHEMLGKLVADLSAV